MLNQHDVYHRLFYEESEQQIKTLEKLTLNLEASQDDPRLVQEMFRQVHSLKGAATTLGIESMTSITHSLESLFELKRSTELCFTTDMIDLILEALDQLRNIHDQLFDAHEDVANLTAEAVVEEIDSYLKLLEPMIHSITKDEQNVVFSGLPMIKVMFDDDAELICVKAYMVIDRLKSLVKVMNTQPKDFENAEDNQFKKGFLIEIEHNVEMSDLKALLQDLTDISELTYESPFGIDESQSLETNSSGISSEEPMDISYIRVRSSKIDEMVNLAGEFVLIKEKMKNHLMLLKKEYAKNGVFNELIEAYEHLHDLSLHLRALTIDMRLVPLDVLFSKFPRLLRDLLKNSSKEITLIIEGQDQGIDKSLIEKLSDPMTHLIRNAVDHGFETTAKRISSGKAAMGTLKITALQGQHQVVITIEDDGKGIDIGLIQKKAIEKRFVSMDEAEFMNDGDWMTLLFSPGFSTASEISTVSGRGVGLDVVQTTMHALNGHIDVVSRVGIGTKFILKLPLTLSIMNAVVIKQKKCFFGIPSSMVVEIIRLDMESFDSLIYKTDYDAVFKWQDQVIPYINFEERYHLTSLNSKPEKKYLIVIGIGDSKLVIDVEEIIGEHELVIKPVDMLVGEGRILGNRYDLLGMSILGDGSLVQIVDVSYLLQE